MKREVESSRLDARYVAVIEFTSGATVRVESEWTPAHWERLDQFRRQVIADAEKHAAVVLEKYALGTVQIVVQKETRHVSRVVESRFGLSIDSTLYPQGGPS